MSRLLMPQMTIVRTINSLKYEKKISRRSFYYKQIVNECLSNRNRMVRENYSADNAHAIDAIHLSLLTQPRRNTSRLGYSYVANFIVN